MKLTKLALITSFLITMTYSTNAIIGFGGYGGLNISSSTNDTGIVAHDFGIPGVAPAAITIESKSVENPIVFGGHIYVEIPIIPITIDVSGGASLSSYDAIYTMSFAGVGAEPIIIPDVAFGSYNFLGTIKYNFIKPPIVKPYIAVGVGSEFVLPLASDENLYTGEDGAQLLSTIYQLSKSDNKDYIKVAEDIANVISNLSFESRMIFNAGLGTKIKLPVVPITFHVDYRFNYAMENEKLSFMPTIFHTATAGIGLNF